MLNLAWRNIWRKKWRSLLTAGAVMVVVLLTFINFGFAGAAMNGMYSMLTGASGHMQVRVEGFRDLRNFSDLLVRNAESIEASIRSTIPDSEVVSVLEVPGLLEGEGRSRGVLAVGMAQPESVREKFVKDNLREGVFPATGDLENIALGERLAEALKVGIGDTVYLYAPGTEGFGAAAYTVTGLIGGAGSAGAAYMSLEAAQELAAPDAVSRLEILLPTLNRYGDDAQLPAYRERLQAVMPAGYTVETWSQINPSMAGYLGSVKPIMNVQSLIFFVLVRLLVMNTVYLSIIERVREFGVIRALGTRRRKVMGMVLSKSLLMCGVGALVGAGIGMLLIYNLSQGFSFPGALADLYEEQGLPQVLYASITSGEILTAVVFTFTTGILAALIPAYSASKLEPVEAMRFAA